MIKVPYELPHSVVWPILRKSYCVYWSDRPVTLSEFIKKVGWGSNKTIRNGGIRIGNSGLIKTWPVIKDPKHTIGKSCDITKGKGKELAYLWIQGE